MDVDRQLELIRLAQAGDADAKAALFEQFTPMLWKLARKLHGSEEAEDDLFQVATIALLEGIDGFDFAFGVKPITFLYRVVSQGLWQSANRDRLIRVPANVKRGETEFADRAFGGAVSFDVPRCDGDGIALAASFSDEYSLFDEVEKRLDAERLHDAIEIHLHDRDRDVIKMRMSGATNGETAKRLGISRSRVGQIEARATKRLTSFLLRKKQREPKIIIAAPVPIDLCAAKLMSHWAIYEDEFLRKHKNMGWLWCAEKLNRTPTAIRSRVRRIGIQFDQFLSSFALARIPGLQAEGMTCGQIGIVLGVSGECIRRNMHRLGIPVLPRFTKTESGEKRRQELLRIKFKKKFAAEHLGGVKAAVYRLRAAEIGWPDFPLFAALFAESLRRLNVAATKHEIAFERQKIVDGLGWNYPASAAAMWSAANWLRERGIIESIGGGRALRKYWFSQEFLQRRANCEIAPLGAEPAPGLAGHQRERALST